MSEEMKNEVTEEVAETMDNCTTEQLDQDPVWAEFEAKMKDRTVMTVEIAGIVKSGVVAYIDGVRGFIPASQLALNYVEDLDSWLGKTIDVMIIEAKQEEKRLILSAKKVAAAKERQGRLEKIDAIEVGSVMEGSVESIQPYGAFITFGEGISGLVHISQISTKRIKTPEEVLKVGDTVTVKVIGNDKHKISLSMKALVAGQENEDTNSSYASREEIAHYKEKGQACTNLGDLLKDIKLD